MTDQPVDPVWAEPSAPTDPTVPGGDRQRDTRSDVDDLDMTADTPEPEGER
jgi:hypothetical protein